MIEETHDEITFTIPSDKHYTVVDFDINKQQVKELTPGSVWVVQLQEYSIDRMKHYVVLKKVNFE